MVLRAGSRPFCFLRIIISVVPTLIEIFDYTKQKSTSIDIAALSVYSLNQFVGDAKPHTSISFQLFATLQDISVGYIKATRFLVLNGIK